MAVQRKATAPRTVDVLTEDEFDDEYDDEYDDEEPSRPTVRKRKRVTTGRQSRRPDAGPTLGEILRAVDEVPARTVALLRAEMRTPPRTQTPPQVISHDEDGDGKDDVIEVVTNPDPRTYAPEYDPTPNSTHWFYRRRGNR